MNTIVIKVKEFFTKGHERSLRAKRNILYSFVLRGVSVVVSFLMVPITLHYLNPTKYGVWLTLSSIVGWFYILDIGLGTGLRNKFAEALAKGEKHLARKYVSTSYAILSIIVSVFYVLFVVVNPWLNWVKILNTTSDLSTELNQLVLIVVTFFAIQFILKLVGTILIADQKPAMNDLLGVISSLGSLMVIYFLSKTSSGSLLYLGSAFTVLPALVYLVTSVILFSRQYHEYIPSIRHVDFRYGRELSSLGVKFFIIQISGIIIYSTSNIILTQVLGPAEVVPYNIAYKYFTTITMFSTIVMTPFWSGFTEAYYKNDVDWIRSTMKKLNYIALGFVIIVFIMVVSSNFVYHLWIGDKVSVPFSLTVFMGLYVMMLCWGAPFVFFINGVGKIKLQLYVSVFQAAISFPLAITFTKYLGMGVVGVIVATCIPMVPTVVLWPVQYFKIMDRGANGIWAK